MAIPPITRPLCYTTTLLHRSTLPSLYSRSCRSIHQSSLVSDAQAAKAQAAEEQPKRKRGRPPKNLPNVKKPPPKNVEIKKQRKPSVVSFDYNLPHIPFLDLPHFDDWKAAFKDVITPRLRPTLRNPDTAMLLAEQFIPEGSKDKIVIEASSGPGQLSRALLRLPRERIKKLIIIEPIASYAKYLESLKQVDDRVVVIHSESRDWSTYTDMEEMGILKDVEIAGWDEVHPHLHLIMQMGGGVDAEQVASQLLRSIPDRQWLFKFGRMPMNLILTDRMYERLIAPEDTPGIKSENIRCKVSVMAQAVAELSEVVPYDDLQPYWDHFYPERHAPLIEERSSALDSRKHGNPRVAMEVIPLKQPLIKPGDLDFWDYVARKLFVMKATPMEKAMTSLGPGANNLVRRILESKDSQIDLQKTPRQLDINEWNQVVEVFKAWPFRPTNLGIEQMFAKKV